MYKIQLYSTKMVLTNAAQGTDFAMATILHRGGNFKPFTSMQVDLDCILS